MSPRTKLKPQRLVHELRAALPEDGLLFIENGNAILWGSRYFETRQPHTYYASLGLASMGNAVCAAIGAKVAAPDRAVAALVGDAAFAMHGVEVHSAVERELGIVWVVLNDGGHGMVHHGETISYGHDLDAARFRVPIDIATFARSLGALGFTATNETEARAALQAAVAHGGPSVIDARVDETEVPVQARARTVAAASRALRADCPRATEGPKAS